MFIIKLVIKLSSVTYAFKARELLNAINIRSSIGKNPSPKKGEGCGYTLTVFNASRNTLSYLDRNGIHIKEAVWK